MAFNCEFTQNVKQFVFDGNKISGLDADGKEVFSHTYKYVDYNADLDFYEYQSEDADSGRVHLVLPAFRYPRFHLGTSSSAMAAIRTLCPSMSQASMLTGWQQAS